MKTIDMHGKSVNEVISAFRKEYKIKDWELKYDVLKKPSNGFLGLFGKRQATVRFNLPSLEEKVKHFIEQLMIHMGIQCESIKIYTEQKTVYITIIKPSDAGFLIGKNGNMLEQLQYLVNRVFEDVPNLERIYVDTEDYRYRQDMNFLKPFITLINQVKATGKAVTLEPMQPGERRIIHQYVERDRTIKTMTTGEGDRKRIVIMPVNSAPADKKTTPDSRKPQPEARKPLHEARKPIHEPRKPMHETKKPMHEPRKPMHEPRKPAHETSRPAHEAAKPVSEAKPHSRPSKAAPRSSAEMTPEQRASQSYKRHNQAHQHAVLPQRTRTPEKTEID